MHITYITNGLGYHHQNGTGLQLQMLQILPGCYGHAAEDAKGRGGPGDATGVCRCWNGGFNGKIHCKWWVSKYII